MFWRCMPERGGATVVSEPSIKPWGQTVSQAPRPPSLSPLPPDRTPPSPDHSRGSGRCRRSSACAPIPARVPRRWAGRWPSRGGFRWPTVRGWSWAICSWRANLLGRSLEDVDDGLAGFDVIFKIRAERRGRSAAPAKREDGRAVTRRGTRGRRPGGGAAEARVRPSARPCSSLARSNQVRGPGSWSGVPKGFRQRRGAPRNGRIQRGAWWF